MNITCSHCRSQFKIADDKFPPGARSAGFTCPKCQTRVTVDAPPPAPGPSKVSLNEIDTSAYNPADRPFDFVEEEGKKKLGFEFPEGPVQPKPEKVPVKAKAKPKARPSVPRKAASPKAPLPKAILPKSAPPAPLPPPDTDPKDDGGKPRRSPVPKLPLKK